MWICIPRWRAAVVMESTSEKEYCQLESRQNVILFYSILLKKTGCQGWGANPGPLNFIYFLIFHLFTAEPQRLSENVNLLLYVNYYMLYCCYWRKNIHLENIFNTFSNRKSMPK
jgi:hypothetical protein